MYVLYKDSYGDFDILQRSVVAVSENLETLKTKAVEMNEQRSQKYFRHGEWQHEYRADPKQVQVM